MAAFSTATPSSSLPTLLCSHVESDVTTNTPQYTCDCASGSLFCRQLRTLHDASGLSISSSGVPDATKTLENSLKNPTHSTDHGKEGYHLSVYWKPPLKTEAECVDKSSFTHYWVSDLAKFQSEVASNFPNDGIEIWMDHHCHFSHGIIFIPVALPGSGVPGAKQKRARARISLRTLLENSGLMKTFNQFFFIESVR